MGKPPPPPPPSENAAAASGNAVPGGAESVSDGSREAGFRSLGAAASAEDLASFSFGHEENPERAAFLKKARRGMSAGFLRGHTVCGLTMSAMEVVVLILFKWGDQGEPHPDVPSLPLGLRDLVVSWVTCHRCQCLDVIPIIHTVRLVTTFGPFYSRTSGRDANRPSHGPPGPHSSGTLRTASKKLWSK